MASEERPAPEGGPPFLHEVDPAGTHPDALATLAGGVAHDFNNILTVVSGVIHLLRLDPDLGDGSRANIDLMEEAAERGATICRQMLAYSHGGIVNFGAIDLRDIANDAVRRVIPLLTPGVRLSAEILPRPLYVEGDANQLATAIAAALINAIEATDTAGGGPVSLTLDEENGAARVCIADEGGGMTPEVRARATEPFYTTKPAGPGIGLGLAAAAGVAEAHGGRIEIASTAGHGARVTLVVPAAG